MDPIQDLVLSSFHWGGRKLRLRQPVTCIPSYAHQLWVYECPAYGLHAYAHDRSEALADFHEEMFFLWDGLAGQPDEALTPDARALRDKLVADVLPEETYG